MTAPRILFADDDNTFRRVLARELVASGFEVLAVASAVEALEQRAAFEPTAALIDLRMPGMDGLELLRKLLEQDPQLPIVLFTGHGAVPEAVDAMRHGAYDFLTKPCPLDVLESSLRRACERRELLRANDHLQRLAEGAECPDWIGRGTRSRELLDFVQKVARGDAHVLVHGESGTGKELVAAQIHRASARAARPFVVVHCGAIPASLVESELFGHERGAFTGAERKRIGLLEAADGGTVFLDEVGELPLAVQPTLLRALQFGEIRPVGSSQTRRVDLRIVAATHRDLVQEIAEGRFREDLYYRLATLVVEVPPLRDRREDIEDLATTLLARCATEPMRFDPQAIAALRQHDWPGNVRELENAIVRIATLAGAPLIQAEHVERLVTPARPASATPLETVDLESLERLAVEQAMSQFQGDKPKAAAALGVSLKTLYNKLARLGLRERWQRGGPAETDR